MISWLESKKAMVSAISPPTPMSTWRAITGPDDEVHPFSRYVVREGDSPILSHFASTSNDLQNLSHCSSIMIECVQGKEIYKELSTLEKSLY